MFPDLPPGAKARIRGAVKASDAFLQRRITEAWKLLKATEIEDHTKFMAVLESALRAHRNAKADAAVRLLDAVAMEYPDVDRGADARSEWLKYVVIPFVDRILPLKTQDDRYVDAAMLMRLRSFEEEPTSGPAARKTPAETIDRLRRQIGLTMEDLAADAGVGLKQVYKLKRGGCVTSKTVRKIATALRCRPADLL